MDTFEFVAGEITGPTIDLPDKALEPRLRSEGFELVQQWGDALVSVALYRSSRPTAKFRFIAITRLGQESVGVYVRTILEVMDHLGQPLNFVRHHMEIALKGEAAQRSPV